MPAGPVLEDVTPRETLDAALAAFDVPAFRARAGVHRAADERLQYRRNFLALQYIKPAVLEVAQARGSLTLSVSRATVRCDRR
jgi:hypothetical protein